jgi:integrase
MDVPAAASGDFVFVNLFRAPLGSPMRLDAVNDLVTAAAERAGTGALRPHQLRHSFASNVKVHLEARRHRRVPDGRPRQLPHHPGHVR